MTHDVSYRGLLRERLVASSDPDLVWRANISGLLADLTKQVLELTEIVLEMNRKLAAQEANSGL